MLYRAKEILGAHHADLSPVERAFYDQLARAVDAPDVAAALYNPDALNEIARSIEKVADAAEKLLGGALTEDAAVYLIWRKYLEISGWEKNPDPTKRLGTGTIRDVLRAARAIRDYVRPEAGA